MIDARTLRSLDDGDARARAVVVASFDSGDRADRHAVLDDLAVRAASGSAPATRLLIELVHAHRLAHPAIVGVLIDPADIDDAAQLTLIAIAEKINTFEGRSRFRTWMGTIARNEALMLLRRKRRKTEPSGAEVPDEVGFVTRLSSVVTNDAVVGAALARLPDHYREALELREVQQLEYEEIADLLGVPIGTVRSRIARAREQLAQQVWSW